MTAKKKAPASRSTGASTAPEPRGDRALAPAANPGAAATAATRKAREAAGNFNRRQRAEDDDGNAVALPSAGGPLLINGHHPACFFENGYDAITFKDDVIIAGEACPDGCGPAEG